MPQGICKECDDTIDRFDGYREKVLKSQQQLAKRLVDAEAEATKVATYQIKPSVPVSRKSGRTLRKSKPKSPVLPPPPATVKVKEGPKGDDNPDDNDDDDDEPLVKRSRAAQQRRLNALSVKSEAPLPAGIGVGQMQEMYIRNFGPITCSMCPRGTTNFGSTKELVAHFGQTHPTKRWFIKCSFCNNQFRRRSGFYYHILSHTDPGRYQCDVCAKVCAGRSSLWAHRTTHWTDDQKPHQCQQCDRRFATLTKLKAHQKSHIAKEEYTFECDLCHRRYVSRGHLRAHHLEAHSANTFVCEVCAKPMRSMVALRAHIRQVHAAKGPKIKCPICGKILLSKANLRKHERTIHEDAGEQQCKECAHVSPNKRSLASHVTKCHGNKRAYDCKICEKSLRTLRGYRVNSTHFYRDHLHHRVFQETIQND